MKIIGHNWIESPIFKTINSIEDIHQTLAKDILLFNDLDKNIEIIKYSNINNLPYAIRVKDIKEAILSHNLNASYIVVLPEMAKDIQDIAQNYLFDTLVLVEIDNENKIEYYAKLGIDGVIFSNSLD